MSPDSPDLAALVRRVNDALAQVDHSLRNLEQARKDLEQSREVIADILGGFLGEKPPPTQYGIDWARDYDPNAYPHWVGDLATTAGAAGWYKRGTAAGGAVKFTQDYPYGNVPPCPHCGNMTHFADYAENHFGIPARLVAVCGKCRRVIPEAVPPCP